MAEERLRLLSDRADDVDDGEELSGVVSAPTAATDTRPQVSVLVADDNPADIALLKAHLRASIHARYVVDAVHTFEQAWLKMAEGVHDAFVIDRNLGPHDGIQLIRNCRASGFTQPLILLTGEGGLRVDRMAMSAGATDYLEKGGNMAQAERVIRYAVERHRAQKDAEWLIHHDQLTGLSSRAAIRSRIEDALGRAARNKRTIAVLYANVSGFRKVNEELGHAAGDAVLRQIAARLAHATRPSDVAARLGGDEFLYVADELKSADDAHELFNTINSSLSQPYTVGQRRQTLRIPMGAVTFPEDGEDLETLVTRADAAMQRARARGDGVVEFWSKARQMRFRSSREMLVSMDGALERGDFLVHYQPIFRAADRALIGVEALLRWQHMDHGLVTPREFMKALERTDQLNRVGEWVMSQAVSLAAAAKQQHGVTLRVCVNVSARELLHIGLPSRVNNLLREHGVAARQLQIEIAELALEGRMAAAEPAIDDLRALGVKVAVDGFGRSRGTLDVLTGPRFDSVKVGSAMLGNMAESRRRQKVVEAVIQMWRSLGTEVWADAVETARDAELLKGFGCDYLQGYACAGPQNRDQVLAFVAKNQA